MRRYRLLMKLCAFPMLPISRPLVLLGFLTLSFCCVAGSEQANTHDSVQAIESVRFSKRVEHVLAEHRVEVALVARVGRPRHSLPAPLRFTHVAIAVYSQIETGDGQRLPGYVFYNLYQDRTDKLTSYLAKDSAVNFFAQVVELEAGILIPVAELQQELKGFVTSAEYTALHRPEYSILANPFTLKYQNCTEFVLDTLTAVIYDTTNKHQIKANLQTHFPATELKVSRAKLVLARIFNNAVILDDHRATPRIASFQSIASYLTKHGALEQRLVVTAAGSG